MANIAIVFPGQGSQSVGMLSDLYAEFSAIKEAFTEVSDALGYDLWNLVQQGPETLLNQTQYTQVAMLTSDVAIYNLLKEQNFPKPNFMAGHSLGEYAALVAAGSITLVEGAKLVATRAKRMQESVPLGEGAMAAIVGLTDKEVETVCLEASVGLEQVTPANYNAIGQVVIAGHTKAVERALVLAESKEARLAKIIPVSVPCHCPLLKTASEEFYQDLVAVPFKKPEVNVISNVDLSIYQDAEHIQQRLAQQLYSPVRWVETIQDFKQRGVEVVLECGPGKVLSGLIKRTEKSLTTHSIYDINSLLQAKTQLGIS
jgi:[acyl-carrier-protein] S-malonyltransferase